MISDIRFLPFFCRYVVSAKISQRVGLVSPFHCAGIPQQLYPYPIHAWQQGLRWWREPQSTKGRYLMLQWPLLWLDGKRQRETRTRNNQPPQSNPLGPDILLRNWNPQPTLGGNSRRLSLS